MVGLVLGSAPLAGISGPDPSVPFVRAWLHRLCELGWIEGSCVAVIQAGGEKWLLDAAQTSTKTVPIVANFRDVAHPAGLTFFPAEFDIAAQLEEALAKIVRKRADALMVAGDGPTYFNMRRIVAFAAEHRLPAIYATREAAEAGGLMTYGYRSANRWRQGAGLVDRFLRGAKLGEVPAEQPTSFELVINAKSAKTLGLTIPPSLLARADEVIQ